MKFLRLHLISPLVTFFILIQVDQMLFCTFIEVPAHNGAYWSYYTFINSSNSNYTGDCLKRCLEEFPDFYKATENPEYVIDSGVEWYNLERRATNRSCPMAESLFPAYV
ncbi:hypothetical protein V3C99_011442 [Haemonchus contortus]